MLLQNLSPLLSAGYSAVPPIDPIADSALPAWVPKVAQIREDMRMVFGAAKFAHKVLESDYVIAAATVKDGWVTVTVKRHALIAEILVGHFDTVTKVMVRDNVLWISYKSPQRREFWWGLGGFAAGVISAILMHAATK